MAETVIDLALQKTQNMDQRRRNTTPNHKSYERRGASLDRQDTQKHFLSQNSAKRLTQEPWSRLGRTYTSKLNGASITRAKAKVVKNDMFNKVLTHKETID